MVVGASPVAQALELTRCIEDLAGNLSFRVQQSIAGKMARPALMCARFFASSGLLDQ